MKKRKRCSICAKKMRFSKKRNQFECHRCGFPEMKLVVEWRYRRKRIKEISIFKRIEPEPVIVPEIKERKPEPVRKEAEMPEPVVQIGKELEVPKRKSIWFWLRRFFDKVKRWVGRGSGKK